MRRHSDGYDGAIIFVHCAYSRNHMGAINGDGIEFLNDLGRHITQVTDDNRLV